MLKAIFISAQYLMPINYVIMSRDLSNIGCSLDRFHSNHYFPVVVNNPFLFKLETADSGESYLFGTMHISEGKDIDKLYLVKDKINACETFANEMHLGKRHLMDTGSFHMDTPLSSLMSEKQYKKCRRSIIKSFDIDLNHVGSLKPLLVSNMIAEVVLGKTDYVGLDQYLFNYAEQAEKNITGVGKVEEQANIMEQLSITYQIKALRDISKNPKAFRRSIHKMNELYRSGDLERLHKKAKKSLGKMRKVLLWDRNKIMADRIEKMIQESPSFIAIGAGHLSGSKGVIRLLKKKGIQVRKVKSE